MCNPTNSPPPPKASLSRSHSQPSSSTMSSSSSSNHNHANSSNHHNTNTNTNTIPSHHRHANESPREDPFPIHKLVVAPETSDGGSSSSSGNGSSASSLSPPCLNTVQCGQESRDDFHGEQPCGSPGVLVGAPDTPRSFRFRGFFSAQQQQHQQQQLGESTGNDDDGDDDGDDDDEIPGLIDEETERRVHRPPTAEPCGEQPWRHHEEEQRHQRRRESPPQHQHPRRSEGAEDNNNALGDPKVPSAWNEVVRSSVPPPVSRSQWKTGEGTGSNNTNKSTTNTNAVIEQQQPFFLLDRMLEDLIPDHQDVQDLAELLRRTKDSLEGDPPLGGAGIYPSWNLPLRKSKSCDIGSSISERGSSLVASYPITRFLPWSQWKKNSNNNSSSSSSSNNNNKQAEDHGDSRPGNHHPPRATGASSAYRPASPIPSRTPPSGGYANEATAKGITIAMPTMLETPKSSNRRACKMRQKLASKQRECLAGGLSSDLLVPKNLQDTLDQPTTPTEGTATNGDERPPAASFPKLMPRVEASSSSSSSPESPSRLAIVFGTTDRSGDHPARVTNNNTPTKKSASCPDFVSKEDHHQEQEQQQLRKRREQLDRRERRNKFTIVQRSLTLAQGWNNKGLSMAGKATRAEQQHLASALKSTQGLEGTGAFDEGSGPERWWDSALQCWDNALEIYRSLFGEYHEKVADIQNNRGIALGKLGRFDDALGALGIALEGRKKQRARAMGTPTTANQQPPSGHERANGGSENEAPAVAAIVSTLHNIANVFRDAGNRGEALNVLVEAQTTLRDSESRARDGRMPSSDAHRNHCKHQLARLGTAIGHVCYESESWRDARHAYLDALGVYEVLEESLSRQSDRLGWGGTKSRQAHPQNNNAALRTHDPAESKRLELLNQQQMIRREVSLLEEDLDELDRRQQARDGSRARVLQARRQQIQRQHDALRRGKSRSPPGGRVPPPQQGFQDDGQQHQQHQQEHQQEHSTLFGIVSSLRA